MMWTEWLSKSCNSRIVEYLYVCLILGHQLMDFGFQYLIVGVVVAAALAYVISRIIRTFRECDRMGRCGGCPLASKCRKGRKDC